MQYKQFGNQYIIRIDKGEELIEKLTELVKVEKIRLAKIQGIGATDKLKIGLFETSTKEYRATELKGDFEICPLFGIINTMKNEPYLHLHINVADGSYRSFGGHLNYAYISATFEGVIELMDGSSDREFDDEIGLNLLKL